MAFEAYSVAIKLSLINHVSEGLLLISKNLKSTHMDAKKFDSTLASIGKQMAVGGVMFAGGAAITSMFKKPLEEAQKFQNEMAKFQALGLGDETNQRAADFAKHMKVVGVSAIDNAKLLREATSIMGDYNHAQEAMPILTKMNFGLSSVMGSGHAERFDEMFQSAIKVTELRGALINKATGQIDIPKFENALNQMTKAYVSSGGLVTPKDYLQAIKTGGVSTKMMSDEMFYYGLGHFMQESGGSRSGTASMSMFQNWAMGRMTQQTAEKMASFGLLDSSKIHYGKTNHITKVDPMGIKDAKAFVESPFKWVNEVAIPQLMKKGIKGDALNLALAQMLGIRTASNLADQFVRDQKLAENYIKRAKMAYGVDQLYQEGAKTLTGEEMIFHAQWSNLMVNLGTVILPLANKALEKLNPWLAKASEWIDKNQGKVKEFTYAMLGLSAALVTGGAINMIAGAARGFGLLFTVLGSGSTLMTGHVGIIGKGVASIARWMLWPVTYVGGKIGGLFTALGSRIFTSIGALLSPIATKVMPMISSVIMWGLRAIPVIGWVVGLVSLGVYLWRNWDEVVKKAKALWTKYGHYITDGWTWVKNETTKIWEPIKAYLSDIWTSITSGIKAAFSFVWDQFTWLFDKLGYSYKDVHKQLNSGAMKGPTFMNDGDAANQYRRLLEPSKYPPVPGKQNQTVQVSTTINLDGKKIADNVTKHQTRQAARPQTGTSAFDGSMFPPMPGTSSFLVSP